MRKFTERTTFYARIQTSNNGYIAINQEFGTGFCYWLSENMEPVRPASIQDWIWASSKWDNPIEKGEWTITVQQTFEFKRERSEYWNNETLQQFQEVSSPEWGDIRSAPVGEDSIFEGCPMIFIGGLYEI